MFFSGFADEACADLAGQIEVTKELGWRYIELRNVDGKMLGTMDDREFEALEQQLSEAGVSINCYGSAVANWACHPRKDEDFEKSRKELLTAIPRMQKLGCKMLRGMSFLVPEDEPGDSPELEDIIFAKVRELVKICEDNGIVYGHENCMNYGGMSYVHTLKLIDAVDSPAFTLIFDTGNPCFNLRQLGSKPYPIQSSWEFYRRCRPFITHVHIKDAVALPKADGSRPDPRYTFAGDGTGDVRAIMIDLRESGYDGGITMEPHVGTVFHDQNADKDSEEAKSFRRNIYLEYCRRFTQLMKECGWFLEGPGGHAAKI